MLPRVRLSCVRWGVRQYSARCVPKPYQLPSVFNQPLLTLLPEAKARANTPPGTHGVSKSLPTISYLHDSNSTALHTLQSAATSNGLALVKDISTAPFPAIQGLFNRLSFDKDLAARLNATYPKRGVYKNAALANSTCDQKVTIDLSRRRISRISDDLRVQLGEDFEHALAFFDSIHNSLVPLLLHATSRVIGQDLAPLHAQDNVNYRMCDYHSMSSQVTAPRCGQHRDYGTFTILFQNGQEGLEYCCPSTGSWLPIPGDAVVVLWGLCAQVMSDDRIRAVSHRVQKTSEGKRRNTAVMFVAPDLDASLRPLVGRGIGWSSDVRNGKVNVGGFKEFIGKRWRYREGNEKDGIEGERQDEAVERFLRE